MIESNSETVISRTTLPLYESEVSNSTTINCDHYGNMTIFGSNTSECIECMCSFSSNRIIFCGFTYDGNKSKPMMGVATILNDTITVDAVIVVDTSTDSRMHSVCTLDSNRVIFGGYTQTSGVFILASITDKSINLTLSVIFGSSNERVLYMDKKNNNEVVFSGDTRVSSNSIGFLGTLIVENNSLRIDNKYNVSESNGSSVNCVGTIFPNGESHRLVFGGSSSIRSPHNSSLVRNNCILGVITPSSGSSHIVAFGNVLTEIDAQNSEINCISVIDSGTIVFGGKTELNGAIIGVASVRPEGITVKKIVYLKNTGSNGYMYSVGYLGNNKVVFCGKGDSSDDGYVIVATVSEGGSSINVNNAFTFGAGAFDYAKGLAVLSSNSVVFNCNAVSSPSSGGYDCVLFMVYDFNYEMALVNPIGWKLQKVDITIAEWTPLINKYGGSISTSGTNSTTTSFTTINWPIISQNYVF